MEEPIWIQNDVVLAVHQRQIAEHGGINGTRDPEALESALHNPKHTYHYADSNLDIALIAASYAFGISSAHPFLDGNKRTAFVICRLFLKLNGYNISTTQEDKYLTFMKLAAGDISQEQLADWIRPKLMKKSL